MDKRSLTERDICTKFIMPALRRAGWDEMLQVREELYFTNGRIIVRGKLVTRGKAKKADFVLYYKPNMPIALIEAKDNSHRDHILSRLTFSTTVVRMKREGVTSNPPSLKWKLCLISGRTSSVGCRAHEVSC